MAKVIDFPMKKLPDNVEDYLYEAAEEYVVRLNTAMTMMNVNVEHPDYNEVMELIMMAFINGIIKATTDQEES